MSYELFLDSWDEVGGPEWVVRFGMTSDDYQRFFDEFAGKGFRPRSVSGYEANDAQSRYVALFERRDGPGWSAQHGLDADAFQARVDQAISEKSRPTFVDAWVIGGREYFAVGWEEGRGARWSMRHGLTAADHQAYFDEMTGKGLRSRWITAYSFGREVRYAAIFDDAGTGRYVARHNIDEATFRRETQELPAKGLHLVCASACSTGSGDVFAGIWVEAGRATSDAHHGMTGGTYQLTLNRLSAAGARPLFATGYRGDTPVDVVLDFSMQAQEQPNWCWAAVTVGVANFLDGGPTWTQCGLVNTHLERTDCCRTPGSADCNVANGVDRALQRTPHFAEWKTTDVPFATLKEQLLLGRPVSVMVNWAGTPDNHYVVVTGCEDEEFVHVDDPGGGGSQSFIPYTTLQTAYGGNGVWQQTILSQ